MRPQDITKIIESVFSGIAGLVTVFSASCMKPPKSEPQEKSK